MPSTAAIDTVFAFFVRNLQFEVSYPVAVAFIVVCAAAWILTVMDIRGSSKQEAGSTPPSLEEIDREFSDLVRRR
jgi:hypothetical protein